ncbi:MAG: GuaB3 family IMP dehydrogenase-related protein [Dehalogenimonas sp.]|uniref:GuaB3 family IMP dehydrogenase-related protein n=1 Tax=Candidatus Dehalogenimonas loeffleri TaxID=3127115 RepID=A0ABZ2J183_9CHLR|nr:GuaB3 family IMP dehydrogenase-related protein [Dehalogenimonas sp.]
MTHPQFKELRRSYGFDEVAIVPGDMTINPEQTDVGFKIADIEFQIPVIAAAMDAVTDVNMAIKMSQFGGLAVLHGEGIQARYHDAEAVLAQIAETPQSEVTALLQKIYTEPIKDDLIAERVKAIKAAGGTAAVAIMPANAKRLAPVIAEAGADILVIASTVTTARHVSKSYRGLIFSELCSSLKIPVVVGNAVSYSASLELMREGVAGIFVGVGPGAACTSREVLGLGVPQITATMDCAAARETYLAETGRYVTIITDGGFKKGGDFCKAIAAGADAAMFGSIIAKSQEAPGHGYHWGMSHPHPSLPRGTRIKVGTTSSLEQILFGPTSMVDGSQNFVGALKTVMGVCGAADIREMQKAEMVIAPAITTEGKSYQLSNSV